MRLQTVNSSKLEDNKYRSKKYVPYVFTEQWIAMLSGLLKNDITFQNIYKKISLSIWLKEETYIFMITLKYNEFNSFGLNLLKYF